MRGIRNRLFAPLAMGLAVAACSGPTGDGNRQSSAATASTPGGSFRLVDTKGRSVTDQTLKGKPTAMFFGFTRCPDVCPTTMNRMALLHRKLGTEGNKLNIVFVSVDPEHDKREDIASFLSMFDAPVIGLTGEPAELDKMTKAYKVYIEKVPLPNGDYTIDHTARILLFDRNGGFVETMDSHAPEPEALGQLQQLIRG
ncbi:SCO family protein [Sphingomonas sp. HF-S4]|uniref:SCO family protein n=1 Tax=Sphingomonas agrestis TaxID=3080540 RepID=A0ABU3Y6B8_9SPHN|nr:SCO family protein [Sphingomonas sp. HF-S4]MDV3456872.1 SCO family protein [Sphingomonas sp. HF-S4]